VGRALGHGGFGVTYLAWDTGLATRLAVKEYLPHGVAGRAANTTQVMAYSDSTKAEFEFGLERFLEEARTLKKFKNFPGIVSIDTVFRDNGTAYLVMEYLDGSTFEDFLKQRGNRVGYQTALEIMLPVMRALAAVHNEGILHRDISPDNIYVTSSGVKLIDFGAARNALGQKSRNLSIILKEGFAPEEQYRSSGTQGPWTDVYATAGTLYFALTGKIPQGALDRQVEDKLEYPSRLGSDIDPRSEAALMRALSIRAHDRFQSMQDFSAALTGMAFEEPVQQQYAQTMQQAPPPYQPYEFMPPAAPVVPPPGGGGNKGLWIAIGVVAVLLIGYLLMKPTPTPGPAPTGATGATGTTGGNGGQASNPPAGDYKGLLQQAAALDQKHSYQDELVMLDKAIQLDPNRFEAYDLKAQIYLYNFKQWPEAKDNFEKSLAHGGNATFHVMHDHGGGIFSAKCNGWLYVTRDGLEYKASDQSQHKFKVRRSEITDIGSSKPFGSSPDHHAFHMRINKVLWNLAPQGEFGDEQRSMILGIIGG
jgi:hypothetical protein